jgi:carboxyl-terminal processing protease
LASHTSRFVTRMTERLLRVFLLVLLLTGGAATSARAQDGLQLSAPERVKVFERVWQAVNDNYYDRNFRGVDWRGLRASYLPLAEAARDNAEFYTVLRRMLGELRDAHTRVYAPEEGFDRYRPAGVTVGLMVRRVEDQPVVVWVEPGSEAARQGIRPGLAVTAVDGLPIERALAQARAEAGDSSSEAARELQSFHRLFYGPRDTKVKVSIVDEDARTRTLELTRRFAEFPRRVTWQRLPGDIGYIELTGFAPEIERDFERAMQALKDTRGLILDLRNNGGGFVHTVAQVASYFFTDETALGEFIARNGRGVRHRTQRLRAVYRGPLTVLVSARSASGAEMLAAALQEQGRAVIIGANTTTCGCLLGVSRTLRLPDGGKLNVSDTDYLTARGQRIEGAGVKPDQQLELRIADLLAGRDRVLELAVERLTQAAAN